MGAIKFILVNLELISCMGSLRKVVEIFLTNALKTVEFM